MRVPWEVVVFFLIAVFLLEVIAGGLLTALGVR